MDYRNSASKKPKSRQATRGGLLSAEAKARALVPQSKAAQAFSRRKNYVHRFSVSE